MLNVEMAHEPTPLVLHDPLLRAVRDYWHTHVHDLEIATHPPGTTGFFRELDEYRFDKLDYLPRLVDFSAYRGKNLLEVGCGVGIDLVRFARGGTIVTGVDIADNSITLARMNFEQNGLAAELKVMNGEDLQFEDNSFDVVYAHGVLQYTPNPQRMIGEIRRVLRPGGVAIMMVYNRYSWLNALSKVMRVELEHQDAPVLRKYSVSEFRGLLKAFPRIRIVVERFPVKSQLHRGLKGKLYNQVFVAGFKLLPKRLVRPLGWHIMAFVSK